MKEKSYKDTTDFLNKLQTITNVNSDSLLVSLDVTSLYTRGLVNNSSNLSLIELLSLVLTLNNFRFNEEHYLQIGGMAMGTRLAPSFVNIFMNDFEEKYVYLYHRKPEAWYGYIEDIFLIWNHGQNELNKFITYLNSCCENITFSSEISKSSLSFLDVTVQKVDAHLETDLFGNTYLPYTSAHPRPCMKGLPYGQFLRIRRICSDSEDFETHATKKAAKLLQHGYPKELF